MTRLAPHPFAMRPRLNVGELLDSLDSAVIPGGCDDCDAEQRVERIRHLGRVTKITIVHDPACRALARKAGRW